MKKTNFTTDDYWSLLKKNDGVFDASSVVELFLARLVAFRRLATKSEDDKILAKNFLLRTMVIDEELYNFPEKEKFISQIDLGKFSEPDIKCFSDTEYLMAIVYTIDFEINGVAKKLHEISFFTKKNGNLLYTHKYDIAQQYQMSANNIARAQQKIRKIGDEVLHRKAINVCDFSKISQENINAQLAVMRRILGETGGGGIAANQCVELLAPLNIVLVGVDYDNPEHVAKVVSRYPTVLFPPIKTYINLVLIGSSDELEVFPEGCLSVQGPMRALVLRPRSVKVRYQDMEGNYHEEQFAGSAARAILHELDHISEGKVYFQRILEELKIEDLECIKSIVLQVKSSNKLNEVENLTAAPVLAFKRNANNALIFDSKEVKNLLEKSNTTIIEGIYWALSEEIRARTG